jgi:hypothetical protein
VTRFSSSSTSSANSCDTHNRKMQFCRMEVLKPVTNTSRAVTAIVLKIPGAQSYMMGVLATCVHVEIDWTRGRVSGYGLSGLLRSNIRKSATLEAEKMHASTCSELGHRLAREKG